MFDGNLKWDICFGRELNNFLEVYENCYFWFWLFILEK